MAWEMRTADVAGQIEFGERVVVAERELALPRVRPTADEELAATFVRAAVAWAKWRERRRWGMR